MQVLLSQPLGTLTRTTSVDNSTDQSVDFLNLMAKEKRPRMGARMLICFPFVICSGMNPIKLFQKI